MSSGYKQRGLIFLFVVLSAAAAITGQDIPAIGIVEVYGLRGKVSLEAVRGAAGISPGDDAFKAMSGAKAAKARIRRLPFVACASVKRP